MRYDIDSLHYSVEWIKQHHHGVMMSGKSLCIRNQNPQIKSNTREGIAHLVSEDSCSTLSLEVNGKSCVKSLISVGSWAYVSIRSHQTRNTFVDFRIKTKLMKWSGVATNLIFIRHTPSRDSLQTVSFVQIYRKVPWEAINSPYRILTLSSPFLSFRTPPAKTKVVSKKI